MATQYTNLYSQLHSWRSGSLPNKYTKFTDRAKLVKANDAINGESFLLGGGGGDVGSESTSVDIRNNNPSHRIAVIALIQSEGDQGQGSGVADLYGRLPSAIPDVASFVLPVAARKSGRENNTKIVKGFGAVAGGGGG